MKNGCPVFCWSMTILLSLGGCGPWVSDYQRTYRVLNGDVSRIEIRSAEIGNKIVEPETYSYGGHLYTITNLPDAMKGIFNIDGGERRYIHIIIEGLEEGMRNYSENGGVFEIWISYEEYSLDENYDHIDYFKTVRQLAGLALDANGNFDLSVTLGNELESTEELELEVTREIFVSETNVRMEAYGCSDDDFYEECYSD